MLFFNFRLTVDIKMSPNLKHTPPLLPPEMIKSYLETIPDPFLLYRLESNHSPGRIVLCNHKVLEKTGYSRNEILKMNISDLSHPDSGLKDDTLFDELQTGDPVLFERIIIRKNKTSFPVEVNGHLVEYQGETMVLSILRDISKRKKTEEETHLHLMFEKIVSNISSRFINIPDHRIDAEIEITLKKVCEFIGAIRGRIFLFTEDRNNLTISHQWCSDKNLCNKEQFQKFNLIGFTLFHKKFKKLEDVVIDTPDDLPSEESVEREWFDKNGFYPIFNVPIISEDQVVGVLGFTAENNRNHHWPRQYGHMLRYISTFFYNAINRKEISRKFRLAQITLDHHSTSVFWLSIPDYLIIDVNPAACRSLGYEREELLKLKLFDFCPLLNPQTVKDFAKKLKKTGSNTMESMHQRKNGEEFPVEVTSNYIEFEGNNYVVAFALDISSRKAAEEQLLQSEQEYRKIFENVAQVFYEASLDGILLNVTPSVKHMTNFLPKDLIGKPMETFYFDPAVREPFLKALYEKGEILDFELDIKDLDGDRIPASINSSILFDENGKPERIVGSIIDLRKRRKVETQVRQLSTALEQSPVSVIILDTDLRILHVNKSFTSLTGMQLEDVLGNTPSEITNEQIPLKEPDDLWDSVKNGHVWRGDIKYLNRDGSQIWLSIAGFPVLDDQNRVINYVGILEDITERKTAEQNLQNAKEQAEKSDHLKSAFLANMSHEIRTPMNAILGFSSLLKDKDLDPEQSDYYIDIINSKGKDLIRIISDIIDISRIEAGDLYIKTEPVDIFPFVRDVFNEFKKDTQIRNRNNLQFRLNLPDPEKKTIVNTDPFRLKQIFVNLIQNALKFTPDGFVEVGFNLKDNNDIDFFVKDSGVGIPEDKQKIIFKRFRQIDDSHTRKHGGTGLGLTICKNLLDLMGSNLSLKSIEGQGSEFTFGMKYILTASPEVESGFHESNLKKNKLDLREKTILIVEDDGPSYLFLETLLSKYSPEIFWAKSGKQALEIMKSKKKIDIILMDIRMPEMDGMEATRQIRETNMDIPIIAQTAYAQVTDRKLAIESGCNDYLSKPISPVELTKLLAKYLNPTL